MYQQFVNQPIPKILSLLPKDENFIDSRETTEGAWLSDNAWEKINNIFSLSQNDEALKVAQEIKEENSGPAEGVFLTDKHFAVVERNVSLQLGILAAQAKMKSSDEKLEQTENGPSKLPAKVNTNKPTETWEQKNMTALMRLISQKATKGKSAVKKN